VAISAISTRALGIAAVVTALPLGACQPGKQPATHLYDQPARVTLAAADMQAKAPPEAPDDQDITRAVARELAMDGSVAVDGIEIATRAGAVTLTGEVAHLLARERATRLAELVKGVREVDNRLRVVPGTTRADDSLRLDVESALHADPATASHRLAVAVESRAVTLTGTVPSWAARQLAVYVASGVKGVTELHDRIQIAHQRTRSDREIEDEIARRLRWDALIDASAIHLDVERGQVRMHGAVGSAAERTRAFHDAWVTGVSAVDHSALEVQWWLRERERVRPDDVPVARPDEAVEQAIRDAAHHDARVSGFRVEPEVTAGIVLLRGTVDHLEARRAAEQLARNIAGVVAVKSYVKVSPRKPVADAALADLVLGALLRNPITAEHELRSAAAQGVVTLTGTVDRYFEKVEAENVAENVPGVIEVQNQLEVRHTPHAFVYEPYLYPHYPQPADTWSHYIPTEQTRTDTQIRATIAEELAWTPFLDARELTISVLDGRATLIGNVGSWRERQVATDNAFEGGAIAVINRLGVREN
jgi:osmotically-inducible protein OsmY